MYVIIGVILFFIIAGYFLSKGTPNSTWSEKRGRDNPFDTTELMIYQNTVVRQAEAMMRWDEEKRELADLQVAEEERLKNRILSDVEELEIIEIESNLIDYSSYDTLVDGALFKDMENEMLGVICDSDHLD